MEESKAIIQEEINSILSIKKYYELMDKNYLKMIFKLANFTSGVIELAKLENNDQEILSVFIEEENFDQIINTCLNYSYKDKLIWVQAFSYFVNHDDFERSIPYIKKTLDYISQYNLLSPIVVLQTLRKRKVFQVEVVKDYLTKSLGSKIKEMAVDKKEFEDCYVQIKNLNKKITKLKTKPILFSCEKCFICKESFTNYINSNVANISKIIIFKCHHAFHPLCLNIQDKLEHSNDEFSCPECSHKYEQVNKRIQILYDSASDHNSFFMQLDKKENKFDFIAKNLGRGGINNM